jgi:sulfate transport system ATP-binding protein
MQVTTVFVTHDQEEAFEVADQVVVMRQGRVEQAGSPQEVFDDPATPFVMDFLGNVNVFHGRIQGGRAEVGPFTLAIDGYRNVEPLAATAYVRPHELEIERTASPHSLAGRIVQLNPSGAGEKVRVAADEFGIELNIDLVRDRARQLDLKVGQIVHVRPRTARVFTPDDDYVI